MPDITMCNGTNCELASTCYRYKATPGFRQSYFAKTPIKGGECDYYWKTAKERSKILMRLKK